MQQTTILARMLKISALFLCICLSSQQMPLYAAGNSSASAKQPGIVSVDKSNVNRGTGSSIAGSGPARNVNRGTGSSIAGSGPALNVNRGTGSSIAGSGPLLNSAR